VPHLDTAYLQCLFIRTYSGGARSAFSIRYAAFLRRRMIANSRDSRNGRRPATQVHLRHEQQGYRRGGLRAAVV
jgi:hypothetical protein